MKVELDVSHQHVWMKDVTNGRTESPPASRRNVLQSYRNQNINTKWNMSAICLF